MTNISTATTAQLAQIVRTMRDQNKAVGAQLEIIDADLIRPDFSTMTSTGNTDPETMATVRSGRLMLRVHARNAGNVAKKLRSMRAPSARQHSGARCFPRFAPGMSTAQYINEYSALNSYSGHVSQLAKFNSGTAGAFVLPFDLADYLAPCSLYENGALDFDVIEEPIDAPERTEPEPTRTPEPMVQIVSGLTGAYLGLLPKSAAHAMAQRHGNTIGTPAPADYTITAARYSKTGTMVIKTHSPDGYSTRASRLAATFGRYSHRQGGYTVTAKAAARFSAMYAAGWDGSYISDKAADRKPPAANQTAEAARQVSELIASATTAAALQAEPLSQDQAAALQQHGKDWDGRELCGYYLSEKLDGCRAYWDGSNLYTKTGNRIDAPTITATLPAGFALDGEIYAGRGRFEDARLFVQYGKNPERVQFIAFDAPGLKNKDWPLRLNEIRAHGVPCVDCVQAYTMADVLHALRAVLEAGGEGLMARIPSSEYKPGRSSNLMKLKQHSMAYFSDVPELETVTSEPDALATTCDASSAGNAGSAPTHGRASSAAHLAPQRATHDAHGQRLGQHVSGHSGNWRAVMFRDDCGRPAFEFEGQDGSREVWSFETGRERMAALQAMAREADDAADQSNDASDADQPPAEQAGIESIKDAIRINEREMERVLKSKQKGSKESAYRIELIISELADKLSDALKASKSTTTTGEYQQPAPVPKTETEADTKAADKVPRAVATDFDNDHTANEAAAADATAGDATEHTDTTADDFERAAPQAFDMLAMIAAGMAPAEFVGLGIVYSGDMANLCGRGAITSMDANAWNHWVIRVTLEDGRLFTCDPLSFKESIGNRFKTDFKRHGAPYLAELEAARLAAEASRKAANQAAADEKDRQRRELPQQWPQLKAYDPAGKLSGCTLAAANIRILLKEKFPGHKFSVKCDKFSGGDAIDISWVDGPSAKAVEAISNRFEAGSFNGMDDIYEYAHSVFKDLFGDAKYIHVNRRISDDLLASAIKLEYPNAEARPSVEDYRQARGEFHYIDGRHNARRIEERLNRMGWNFKS